jgi:hypothetical protein
VPANFHCRSCKLAFGTGWFHYHCYDSGYSAATLAVCRGCGTCYQIEHATAVGVRDSRLSGRSGRAASLRHTTIWWAVFTLSLWLVLAFIPSEGSLPLGLMLMAVLGLVLVILALEQVAWVAPAAVALVLHRGRLGWREVLRSALLALVCWVLIAALPLALLVGGQDSDLLIVLAMLLPALLLPPLVVRGAARVLYPQRHLPPLSRRLRALARRTRSLLRIPGRHRMKLPPPGMHVADVVHRQAGPVRGEDTEAHAPDFQAWLPLAPDFDIRPQRKRPTWPGGEACEDRLALEGLRCAHCHQEGRVVSDFSEEDPCPGCGEKALEMSSVWMT